MFLIKKMGRKKEKKAEIYCLIQKQKIRAHC